AKAAAEARAAGFGEPLGRQRGLRGEVEGHIDAWRERLAALDAALADAAPTTAIVRLRERCDGAAERLQRIVGADAAAGLRWIERTQRAVSVHFTPLDVGDALSAAIDAPGGAWLLASEVLYAPAGFVQFLCPHGL